MVVTVCPRWRACSCCTKGASIDVTATVLRSSIGFGITAAASIALLGAGGAGHRAAEDDPPGPQPPTVDQANVPPGNSPVSPSPVKRKPPGDCRVRCLPDVR